MCDVLVAMPDATKKGTVVFAKNSDRPAGECQVLHYSHGAARKAEKVVQCCYVTVPQTHRVLATLGCRPYWCWGYETGMNEAGVVGGNTSVFTRELRRAPEQKIPGLTGMELLRLGLERGCSAEEAVEVIVQLLEEYGQWGSGVRGCDHLQGSYDNAFLLADRREAWILETAGRRWVASRITGGVRSISNELTIRGQWTMASADLKEFAHIRGWCDRDAQGFDFALAYSDHEHYPRQVSHIRQMRSLQLLQNFNGSIEAETMIRILRDHYEDTFLQGPQFDAFLPDFHTLCMHESPAGFTWGNTATSVVVEIDPQGPGLPPFWLAYLPPCSSVYVAYPFSESLPEGVTSAGTAGLGVWAACDAPQDTFRESSLWWRFHRVINGVARDPIRRREVRTLLNPVEQRHFEWVGSLLALPADTRQEQLISILSDEMSGVMAALDVLETRWDLTKDEPAAEKRGMRR